MDSMWALLTWPWLVKWLTPSLWAFLVGEQVKLISQKCHDMSWSSCCELRFWWRENDEPSLHTCLQGSCQLGPGQSMYLKAIALRWQYDISIHESYHVLPQHIPTSPKIGVSWLPKKNVTLGAPLGRRIHGPIKHRPTYDAGGLLVRDRSFAGADYVPRPGEWS